MSGSVPRLAGAADPLPDHGFVGMHIQGMSDRLAAAMGLKGSYGVLVRDVALGGPADLAGFRRGDLIVEFAGDPIRTFDQLLSHMTRTTAGQKVKMAVERMGKRVELSMALGTWQPEWYVTKAAFATLGPQGVTLSTLTDKVRERFSVRWEARGVLVTIVDATKIEGIDLRPGDVIVMADSKPIWEPAQVMAALDQAKDAGRQDVMLLVDGPEGYRFSLLPVR